MPSSWKNTVLSDAVALQRGHDLPTPTRRPGSVPVVGSFGITGWHDEARAPGPGVAIGRSGASIGTATFVDGAYWPLNTCLYVTDFKGNDPRWVYRLLDQIDFSGYNSGSAQPSLNRNFLAQIPVAIPPLDEQRRIASVLGALDDLIVANRSQVARLERLARAVAATSRQDVPLAELARVAESRQVRPSGPVEHYSLPAFDDGLEPERLDGAEIQSNKLLLTGPCVLVSRLNPKWERCWMAYPGANALASTEFVPLVGGDATSEEVWAVVSLHSFWDQMRTHVTGTTGSHQRVDKAAVLTLPVPDPRALSPSARHLITRLVRGARASRDEIAQLTRTRDDLLPMLMCGKIQVVDTEAA